MAKKKTTKKKRRSKMGRPKGARTHRPRGLEVTEAKPISREGCNKPLKGFKRLVLQTVDPEHALRLERLKVLINKKDPALFKLLEPKAKKK